MPLWGSKTRCTFAGLYFSSSVTVSKISLNIKGNNIYFSEIMCVVKRDFHLCVQRKKQFEFSYIKVFLDLKNKECMSF